MHLLTLNETESATITHQGIEIRVTAAEIKGKKVRLGITAPKEVSIVRSELMLTPEEREW